MSSQVDDRPKTNGHVPADPSLRTYRGRSLEEILPQIRAELGPDAVVVRQRDGLMGGIGGFFQQQFVEVQARGGRSRIDYYDDDEPALPEPLAPAVAERAAPAPAAPPAPAGPEALVPEPAPRPVAPLTAAELLAQATGSRTGDPRTPAEILREHSGTFAMQLAAAEERAEPVVRSNVPAAEEPSGRYAPPVPAARDSEPIPLPQRPAPAPVPEPEPELPPAAEAAPVAPVARRATKRQRRAAARAAPARAEPAARAAVTEREPAAAVRATRAEPAAPAAEARAKPQPAAPAARAKPARRPHGRPELPESGVGPQTTQALELAAAIAANVTSDRSAAPYALPAASPTAEDAHAHAPAPQAGDREQRPAPAPRPARSAATVATSFGAPRRSLFGRRRGGVTTPRQLVGGAEAAEVTGTLATHGLAPAAAEELLVDATAHVLPFTPGADVRTAVRSALARRIPIPAPPRLGGRVVAFVGAGGSGKTRCSAGLAAAYAQGSSVPVACLTLAPVDGGAELSALLKPHGVKVEAVATPEAAAQRLAALRGGALVVLDTPAVSPGDIAGVEQLAEDLGQLGLDEVQLVVPATLSAAVAQELFERLAPLEPTGIAMTHADATDHIGTVVELSCATRLPLSYVNSGLELPGALAPADPAALAERLLQ